MSDEAYIRRELVSRLTLDGQHLIGCRRRGAWSPGEPPWSFLSGNAVLRTIGQRRTAMTPAGPFDYIEHSNYLLLFRGGDFQSYWLEDAFDAYALVREYSPHKIEPTIMLLQEHRGQMDVHAIDVPDSLDYTERAEEIVEEAQAEPPGRISKATHRALRTCRYCPVKQRCDATDKLRGEDNDWSTNYPIP